MAVRPFSITVKSVKMEDKQKSHFFLNFIRLSQYLFAHALDCSPVIHHSHLPEHHFLPLRPAFALYRQAEIDKTNERTAEKRAQETSADINLHR